MNGAPSPSRGGLGWGLRDLHRVTGRVLPPLQGEGWGGDGGHQRRNCFHSPVFQPHPPPALPLREAHPKGCEGGGTLLLGVHAITLTESGTFLGRPRASGTILVCRGASK